MKYDIYELAKTFNTLKLSDLEQITQEIKRASQEQKTAFVNEISTQSKNTIVQTAKSIKNKAQNVTQKALSKIFNLDIKIQHHG